MAWSIERLVHFRPDDFLVDGFSHFGFHDRGGRQFAISHPGHVMGRVRPDGRRVWTAGLSPWAPGIPHLDLDLEFPMFVDSAHPDSGAAHRSPTGADDLAWAIFAPGGRRSGCGLTGHVTIQRNVP
jgi:hypothetical protein